MNKLIDILKKAIFPSYLYIAVCILVSLGFLNYSLLSPDPFVWIIYLGYAVYAYTLLLIVLKIPSIVKKYKELKKTNKYLMKYFSDPNLRVKISLIGTFSINIAFGFFQLCLAIFYSSVWFYNLSFYYFVLIAVIIVIFVIGRLCCGDNPTRQDRDKAQAGRSHGQALHEVSSRDAGFLLHLLFCAHTKSSFIFKIAILLRNSCPAFPGAAALAVPDFA